MKKPRFAVIVTSGQKRFRVFDRLSKNSYAATNDRELAERLAAEFSETYAITWTLRLAAWLGLRPLPMPPPEPDDFDPVPEWKRRLNAINAHIDDHKERNRLAGGGRILEEGNGTK